MKRNLSIILCALLLLTTTAFSFTGCGSRSSSGSGDTTAASEKANLGINDSSDAGQSASEKESSGKDAADAASARVAGVWETDLDLSDTLEQQLIREVSETAGDLAEYISLGEFILHLTLNLKDDGTYRMEVDRASAEAAMNRYTEDLRSTLTGYMQSILSAQGVNMTVDQALTAQGTSIDAMIQQAEEGWNIDDIINNTNQEGQYRASIDKLWLSDGLEYSVDENHWEAMALDGDTMTLTAGDNAADEASDSAETHAFDGLYPVVFHRTAGDASSDAE